MQRRITSHWAKISLLNSNGLVVLFHENLVIYHQRTVALTIHLQVGEQLLDKPWLVTVPPRLVWSSMGFWNRPWWSTRFERLVPCCRSTDKRRHASKGLNCSRQYSAWCWPVILEARALFESTLPIWDQCLSAQAPVWCLVATLCLAHWALGS